MIIYPNDIIKYLKMTILKFYNRASKTTIEIDVSYKNYFVEIMKELKTNFNINYETDIKIFYIGQNNKPSFLTESSKIDDLTNISKSIRHFEVFWKNNKHGKQTEYLAPSDAGTVVSGYQRHVSSNVNAGDIRIGDPNGASIFIPAGAVSKDTNISIQTIMVDESKLNLPQGYMNITKAVKSDSKKVNEQMNKEL